MASAKRKIPPGLLTKPDCRSARELARTGNFYVFVKNMSAEFGDVVSLSPDLYLVSTSQLIKETLRNTADFPKADSIEWFKILVGEGLFTADGKIYDQQERVIKSAFGKKYFAGFRRIIDQDLVKLMDERLDRSARGGEPVDIGALSVEFTMSVAARAFFGVGGETELAREFRSNLVFCQDWFARFQAADFAGSMLSHIESRFVRLPVLKPLQRALFRKLSPAGRMAASVSEWSSFVAENETRTRGLAADMRRICAKIIALRRGDERSRHEHDVLSSLLRFQKDPENAWLTDEVIIDQVATFFVAGHETTSDLFLTLLWKHARGETPKEVLDELAGAGDMISEDQFLFQRYPRTGAYLEKILLEHPPIVFTVRQARRDVEIAGYPVAKGTRLILAITSAQDADVSFGFGRRQCIGRVFALEEAVIGLKHLVGRELRLEDPAQHPRMTEGLTIGYSRSPVPILVRAATAPAARPAPAGTSL